MIYISKQTWQQWINMNIYIYTSYIVISKKCHSKTLCLQFRTFDSVSSQSLFIYERWGANNETDCRMMVGKKHYVKGGIICFKFAAFPRLLGNSGNSSRYAFHYIIITLSKTLNEWFSKSINNIWAHCDHWILLVFQLIDQGINPSLIMKYLKKIRRNLDTMQ